MQRAMFVGMMLFFMLVIGFVGGELGITQTSVAAIVVEKPESSGGILNTISNVVAPFVIVWELLGSFFQIISFQAAGIPTTVNTILFIPIAGIMGWLIIQIVRG